MNPFRQILKDTRSLMRDVRKGLQHLAWRLEWWSRKRQVKQGEKAAEAENVRRSVRAATKMCPECRALVPGSAATCPECGVSTAHVRSGGIGRLIQNALPFDMSVSMLLITAFFIFFVAAALQTVSLRAGGPNEGVLPALLSLDPQVLFDLGAIKGDITFRFQPWRLLTAIFLHGGILHLAFNTWALRVIGPLIEEFYGAKLLFVLYLATGVASNIVTVILHGFSQSFFQVGASGAIFGLIGVAAVYGYRRRDTLGVIVRRQMIQWAVYGLVMGFLVPRVDNWAHIGGFLAGAAAAALLPDPRKLAAPAYQRLWSVLAASGVVAVVLAFTLMGLRLYISESDGFLKRVPERTAVLMQERGRNQEKKAAHAGGQPLLDSTIRPDRHMPGFRSHSQSRALRKATRSAFSA